MVLEVPPGKIYKTREESAIGADVNQYARNTVMFYDYEIQIISGEVNGYNIPEVTSASDVSRWFTDEGVNFIESCRYGLQIHSFL